MPQALSITRSKDHDLLPNSARGYTADMEQTTLQIHRRGLLPGDERDFSGSRLEKLAAAQCELRFLLDRGYPISGATAFVGGHHQLSARQRLALARTTSARKTLAQREAKRFAPQDLAGRPIYIDGLNLIITLEVALCDGVLFVAQDGGIRDLAELRGSYRIIPQTETAIALLREALANLKISEATIFLDAPVSNSGRLKTKIREQTWPLPLRVELTRNPDVELQSLSPVASADSVILDRCAGWFNLTAWILETRGPALKLTHLIRLDQS